MLYSRRGVPMYFDELWNRSVGEQTHGFHEKCLCNELVAVDQWRDSKKVWKQRMAFFGRYTVVEWEG